jgi:sugar (pentulose or hexulose) kinase
MLEGLCLQTRWMLAEQTRLAGGPAHPAVHLFGGPVAANPLWVRIKAQVLPGDLRVVPAVEPVATGAALVAGLRAGCTGPDVAALGWQPGPAVTGTHHDYDRSFARFVAAATGGTDPRGDEAA